MAKADAAELSWNRLMRWRGECHRRFGGVLDLPVCDVQAEIEGVLEPGIRVLDVGAGAHKPLKNTVTRSGADYFALDTDPDGEFDFRSFEEISVQVSFHVVIANQVLEHLSAGDAFMLLASIHEHLSANGVFLATVPNAAHPVRQRDCTHITAWPMNDLYSLVRSAGLEVSRMARYNKKPLTRNPLKKWVVMAACEAFRIDWCDSLLIVGRKET
ncbi:MAG: class I SAM-dependent methyltransferase [Desulfomonile sp.]|nr:class I SAM-dependent methyltransferase [Desulfomonile sp.]